MSFHMILVLNGPPGELDWLRAHGSGKILQRLDVHFQFACR